MVKLNESLLTRNKGNTTVEYALIGTLIGLVAITGLLSFSGAFSARVTDLKTDMKARTNAANAQAVQIAAMKSLRDQSGVAGSGLASDAANEANGNGNAMTTGANGNTLGSTGKTGGGLADGLSNLSPEEKSLVKAVANTAHQIARYQELLEQLAAYSAGNMSRFRSSKVVVDGKVMSTYDLAMALGDTGLAAQLEEKKNQVLASGIDAEVKDKVAETSDKVKEDANTTSSTTNEVLATNTNPAQVEAVTDSTETDKNAGEICKASGGKDNGKTCGDTRRW